MMGFLRRISVGLAAMLYAWLSIVLWLMASAPATASPDGSVALDGGARMEWTVSPAEPQKLLNIAAPRVVEWSSEPRSEPVHIPVNTNYAAFIERWEFAIWREGDHARKHPVLLRRGAAAALNSGIDWDGDAETGPPLRPGEALLATLRVRDIAGNVDEIEPQNILIARYLMPKERKRLEREAADRHALINHPLALAADAIPLSGREVTIHVAGGSGNGYHLSDLALRDEAGLWTTVQILPPGRHVLKAQSARPILGGARLVSIGRATIEVPGDSAWTVIVRGSGAMARGPNDIRLDGLKNDGSILGSDAVRLRAWDHRSPRANLALASIDPGHPVPLFRDARSRSVAYMSAPRSGASWGAKRQSRGPRHLTVERRARYPAIPHDIITLPHTDVAAQPFRLSVRGKNSGVTYLLPGKHYTVEPHQGRIAVTKAGRAAIFAEIERTSEAVVEVVYRVRQSLAGLAREDMTHAPIAVEGSGEEFATQYDIALPHAEQDASASVEQNEQGGWIERNFGWLLGS